MNLVKLVLDDVQRIGVTEACRKYGVHSNTVYGWTRNVRLPSAEALQIAYDEYNQPAQAATVDASLWSGRKVMLLLPVYRTMEPDMVHTLLVNFSKYGSDRVGVMIENETVVEVARDKLAERFLATDAEYGIQMDSDMLFPCGSAAAMNGHYGLDIPPQYAGKLLIEELIRHNLEKKSIVGALYFGRNHGGVAQYAEAFMDPAENYRAHKFIDAGLKETKWVATGAMCVHRSVFEKIKEQAQEQFPDIVPPNGATLYGFHKRISPVHGEDVSLCYRAMKCGFTIWVDTSLCCGHIGGSNYGPSNTVHGMWKPV